MRDALARYWVAAHVALLAGFLAWVYGGTHIEYLGAVPWLSLALLEMTLLLPPPRKDETLESARKRVWRTFTNDPLLYVGIFLFLYLLLQFWNGGRRLAFEPINEVWQFDAPPLNWGPFCVKPAEAVQLLYLFPPVFVVVLAIRHGTNRRGKLYLLRALAVNGAALSLFGIIQYFSGASRMFWSTPVTEKCFASFSYNHAGAFFTLLFALSIGLFLQVLLSKDERKHAIWLGIIMALNLAGALFSFSRAGIIFSLALLVLGGFYGIRHSWRLMNAGVLFKVTGFFLVVLTLGWFFLFIAFPNNVLVRELQTVAWSNFWEGTFGVRWQQMVAAGHIWREHLWFGVGGCGFRHYVCLELDETARALMHHGGTNVDNDVLQFLVEHGLIGFGLMLWGLVILLIPIVRRLSLAHLTNVEGWSGEPWLLFRVSPVFILLLAGTSLTFLMSLIDLPFRSPAILVTWCIALACMPSLLPSKGRSPSTANRTTNVQAQKNQPRAAGSGKAV